MCVLLTKKELGFCSSGFLVPRSVLSQPLTGRSGTWETGRGSLAADAAANTSYAEIASLIVNFPSLKEIPTLHRLSSKKALFGLVVSDVLVCGSLVLLLWAYGKHERGRHVRLTYGFHSHKNIHVHTSVCGCTHTQDRDRPPEALIKMKNWAGQG